MLYGCLIIRRKIQTFSRSRSLSSMSLHLHVQLIVQNPLPLRIHISQNTYIYIIIHHPSSIDYYFWNNKRETDSQLRVSLLPLLCLFPSCTGLDKLVLLIVKKRIKEIETQSYPHCFVLSPRDKKKKEMVAEPDLLVRLRQLVQDCLGKHMHSAASFYADKLVTFSGANPGDVYLLAQAYFVGRQYRYGA